MLNEQSILKNLKCGVFRIDLDSKYIVNCNENFLAITGYTNQDIIDNSVTLEMLVHEKYYLNMIDSLKCARQNNDLFNFYCKMTSKQGDDITVILNSTDINETKPQIIINDITKLVDLSEENEKKHNQSQFVLETLMSDVGSPVFNFDALDGTFGFVSEGFVDLFGFTNEEFNSKFRNNFYNTIFEEDRERAISSINSQSKFSQRIEVSYRILNVINSVLWVIFRGRFGKLDDGRSYFFGTLVDITELRLVQDRLSEINLQINALISNVPGGVASFMLDDNDLRVLYANEEYYRLLGYTKIEYDAEQDRGICKFLYEKDYGVIAKDFANPITNNKSIEYEVRVKTKSRGLIWINVRARFYKYIDGKPVYYGIVIDVNDRKKMEYEMKIQTERYRLIEEITEEIQFEYDVFTDTLILPKKHAKSFDRSCEITGFFCTGMVDKLIHPDNIDLVKFKMARAIDNSDKGVLELKAKIYDEIFKWYRIHYVSVSAEDGSVIRIVGRIKNIDEEKNNQVRLEQRLKADPLTELLNKVAIKLTISDYISTEQEISTHAMLLIDIDNFKCVNDTLGHIMGDKAIQDIARNMKSVFRSSDYLGRVGGDEFLVFMKNTNKAVVKEKAKDLCALINQVYKNDQGEVRVSCSIGIAFYPSEGNDYDELFSKADLAMYYSKLKGGNYYISYEEIMENI